jgi:DNA-binding NarL/FixJ family response regulator
MIATTHCTEAFADKAAARTAARRLRMARRITTSPAYCSDCESWHLESTDRRVSSVDRAVLFSIAMGLRTHEIAKDIGETESQVVRRVQTLMQRFDAISRANLAVLAVYYLAIDPGPIASPRNDRGEPPGALDPPSAAVSAPSRSRERRPVA